jgi:hypothetical protein
MRQSQGQGVLSSADITTVQTDKTTQLGRVPGWLWLGIGVYALLLINGNPLLNDPDTYWHIAVGRWMLDHGALPRVDIYSFTRAGEPWISSSWLAQILLAKAYDWAGWSGPVVLTAFASATAFALLTFYLCACIGEKYALLASAAALALTAPHLLARPHVLVLPVMLVWMHGMLAASEGRKPPSLLLLPLMALWANLHGSFVLGLALIAPLTLDALWNAERASRVALGLRWILFAAAALAASCITPYGWGSLLAARKILDLGELLHLIDEWRPADFSHVTPLEIGLLGGIGAALNWRVKLSPPRILLLLGLVHMALSHVRNIEVLALLAPLVVMTPLAAQFALPARRAGSSNVPFVLVTGLVAMLTLSSWAIAAGARYSPPATASEQAAADALKVHHASRVLNDMSFAGFLIARGIPVFIDGRAELYGETFALAYDHALELNDIEGFFNLLKTYDIDSVWLTPETPAVRLLDRMQGWRRVYSDDHAVVHVRTAN